MSDQTQWNDVTMPQLAESLVSATIAKWLKQPGETVEQFEPICEVITDKVNAEIPSTLDGIMGDLLAEEGQTVAVGELICRIQTKSAAPAVASGATPVAPASQSTVQTQTQQSVGSDQSMRGRFSPAVQTLAAEHNVDLSQVPGTGMGGRITRKDVLNYVQRGSSAATGASGQPTVTATGQGSPFAGRQQSAPQYSTPIQNMDPAIPVRNSGIHLTEAPKAPVIEVEGGNNNRSEYFIDVTPIRSAIARNMRQSVSEIPHAWTTIEVDVTNLVMLRNKIKNEFKQKEGINITYLAFLMKAVVNAIKEYPIMNSVWAVDKIIVKRDINISLAVGTEDSVLTPVIKKADQKNIAGLAREIDDLARKTREGTLKLDDMQGGTFTVNNTGSFGSILSYPVINYPQAAILTFESIVKRPVVIDDMIAVRSMANLCLSLDHRILDGVICGRFLQRVKENLEGYTLDTKLY
ncbi:MULTISPECIES: dihydrolipoamide acetyltransferase family protein [Paenibacillus]|uniref:Dihydrolipoamide acetyltransferase component of pyruvate dehydrogenase complex n=1 Tax=Paenibacillus polymyxa TaxID=1406 RepID=A0A8I1IKE0_PAEPO|nr:MULTISPECIES: dihydrolipoamide acetyltransferase family protein [Paenibacillus]KAF6575209.1 2-oxo acid dehydrogenase subunit E2 [Paenibacillus sp. EKM206P]KAF6590118.1 2-oxo acid dehydrogenase subunit E2 [Paenibacillus sp. EKM205P]MBM0632534.1 2-oxo acid dehydrogenase subunit E2 [Paenibacillus polymyxa]UMY52896.1 2-oxo acid dehydrogenase subunit E2 [Paenibacillus peoriae]